MESITIQAIAHADTTQNLVVSTARDSFGLATQILTDKNYVEILEKTNQQMSLWWNPYGIMVATLGALFAVLAVIAAVILWRQGSDYRKMIDKSIGEYKKILDALVTDKIDAMEKRLNDSIEVERQRLVSANSEQKDTIEEKIREMEEKKNQILNFEAGQWIGNVVGANLTEHSNRPISNYIINPMNTCSKCGHQYDIQAQLGYPSLIWPRTVTCPQCGNVERVD